MAAFRCPQKALASPLMWISTPRSRCTSCGDAADRTARYFSIRARDDYGFADLCDLSEVKKRLCRDWFTAAIGQPRPVMSAFGPQSGPLIALSRGAWCDIEPPIPDTSNRPSAPDAPR